MIHQRTVPDGLTSLIRNAMSAALAAGRNEIASSLQVALAAAEIPANRKHELDILAGEVRSANEPIPLSKNERALLIALALQHRPCTRATLVELLYPHLQEPTASTQLKVYVHRVRRRLNDPDAVIFQNDSYRLGPSIYVDFSNMEVEIAAAMRSKHILTRPAQAKLHHIRQRLRKRNTSWAGELEWAITLERKLEAMLFDVTVRLGEAALAEKNIATATQLAVELSDLDPCDERAAELAIRTHLSRGDRSAAVREFHRYQRIIKTEYGAEPSSDLSSLISIN